MSESAESKAARYERRYPDTGLGDAQKAERMERLDLKERKSSGGQGVRFFGVPELPWKKEQTTP